MPKIILQMSGNPPAPLHSPSSSSEHTWGGNVLTGHTRTKIQSCGAASTSKSASASKARHGLCARKYSSSLFVELVIICDGTHHLSNVGRDEVIEKCNHHFTAADSRIRTLLGCIRVLLGDARAAHSATAVMMLTSSEVQVGFRLRISSQTNFLDRSH